MKVKTRVVRLGNCAQCGEYKNLPLTVTVPRELAEFALCSRQCVVDFLVDVLEEVNDVLTEQWVLLHKEE